jgi:transcriptional regulator with XRE-family HTH domain
MIVIFRPGAELRFDFRFGILETEMKLSGREKIREVPSAIVWLLDVLKTEGGLQGRDIANIVDVSPATVSRWVNGTASPGLHTQMVIAALRYVVDRLSEFYSPDEIRLWLHAKHALLGNERAVDLINADRTEEVLAVIDRLNAGAYL